MGKRQGEVGRRRNKHGRLKGKDCKKRGGGTRRWERKERREMKGGRVGVGRKKDAGRERTGNESV
jgi:hypothetical protein